MYACMHVCLSVSVRLSVYLSVSVYPSVCQMSVDSCRHPQMTFTKVKFIVVFTHIRIRMGTVMVLPSSEVLVGKMPYTN